MQPVAREESHNIQDKLDVRLRLTGGLNGSAESSAQPRAAKERHDRTLLHARAALVDA
jgi:hypothetical protein